MIKRIDQVFKVIQSFYFLSFRFLSWFVLIYSHFDEQGIKDLILEGQPNRYNVFGVDWSNGAKTINYFQAVANTRVVGAAMAHFIKKLNQYSGLKFSDIHLIGHSLGAHISGYAGERIKNPQIGRITGLDPAGPSFYKNLTSLRLDPTDAHYVDALHTDYGNAVIEGKLPRRKITNPCNHIYLLDYGEKI